MKDSAKYRKLARRSGIFGIVIWVSICVAVPSFFGIFDHPINWYLMQLFGFLLVVMPIPAIVVGLWSFYGLKLKEHGREIGYAAFGVLTGLISIIAAFSLLIHVAQNFD